MYRNSPKRWLLLGAIVLTVTGLIVYKQTKVKGQSNPTSCPTCSQHKARVIYAPTIGLPEAGKTEIVLNCRSAHEMDTVPTFYTSTGEAIVGETIHLQPAEMRFVTVESLLPEEYRNTDQWGGMSLSYTGKLMEVWAQITLRGKGKHGSSDVVFSVLNNAGADTQDAVWSMPKSGRAVIALGNSSNLPIHTALQFANNDSQEVDIAPFATEYIWRNSNESKGDAVRLVTSGPAGSLKAAGYVVGNTSNYTSSIRFYETPNAVQENLFATDFKIKGSTTQMLLKNTSATSITANPRFLPRDGQGEPVDLPEIVLAPGEIKDVDLGPLHGAIATRTDLDHVSVRVTNSGGPGSLIGALYSQNPGGVVNDVPLRDSGPIRNSTGAYPWRLDDDYETTVVITNVGNEATQFHATILFRGGEYVLVSKELAAGQTAVYDIKKIRNEQIPDKNGHVIPQSVKGGQFRWSLARSSPSQARLIGRSEVVSPSGQVSISYSCPMNCPETGPTFGYASSIPNFNVGIAQVLSSSIVGAWQDGYGYWYYDNGALYLNTLASDDSGIAIVNKNINDDIEAQGVSSGETTWSSEYWFSAFIAHDDYCEDISGYLNTGGDVEVPPCAYPTNFHQVGNGTDAGSGILHFDYAWESSDGVLDHLTQCNIGENVTYSGSNPYHPPSPPFPNLSLNNPTVSWHDASSGAFSDNHSTGGSFVQPYSSSSFTATQYYRYSCPCVSSSPVNIFGPNSIVRTVGPSTGSTWKYTITKSGASATIDPLP